MSYQKYDVSVATNLNDLNQEKLKFFKSKYDFHLIHIPIKRKINLFYDFLSLFSLFYIIYKNKFELTLSLTPKAGLLTALTSFLNSIKIRIHIFNGQIWYNKKGIKKIILKKFDKVTYLLSNYCLCESKSQVDFLISEGFQKKKITVIGNGSLMGVDTFKFKKNKNIIKNLKNKLKKKIIKKFVCTR